MSHHRYPSTDNELMLYRVLQHANLVQYYEAFVSQGAGLWPSVYVYHFLSLLMLWVMYRPEHWCIVTKH